MVYITIAFESIRPQSVLYPPPSPLPPRSIRNNPSRSRTIIMHICKMQNYIIPRVVFFPASPSLLASTYLAFQFTLHQHPSQLEMLQRLREGTKEGGERFLRPARARALTFYGHISLRGKSKFHARSFSMESNSAVMVTHRPRNAIVTELNRSHPEITKSDGDEICWK